MTPGMYQLVSPADFRQSAVDRQIDAQHPSRQPAQFFRFLVLISRPAEGRLTESETLDGAG